MSTVSTPRAKADRSITLAVELAAVLRQASRPHHQPLVIEDRIGQTKSIHIVVIWDAWQSLIPAARSTIIRDAYSRAKPSLGETLTVAMGVTAEEALNNGLLPYYLTITRREGDAVSLKKLIDAMSDADGIRLNIGSAVQLRFPTLEMAEDAYRDLSAIVPGPYWAIVQERLSN